MHHFSWVEDTRTGAQIEYILREYGIPCRRRKLKTGDGLSVPLAQAKWAEYILLSAGVALTSPLLTDGRRAATMPTSWGVASRRVDLTGRLVDWLDTLLLGGANRRSARQFVRTRARRRNR
jgi:hypothetical protein